jgi:mannitol/fructose-specific phosphotransferase system IIA component (Ntr-type)
VLLTDLLSVERVRVPLTARNKDDVLSELLQAALPRRDSAVHEAVMESLRAREQVLSTGIGEGVGIPHAKTPLVDRLVLAAGVAAEPVEFEALDGRPADLFFMLLGPDTAAGAHVRALGRISRLLRRESLREALRDAPDAQAFLQVVAESEAG